MATRDRRQVPPDSNFDGPALLREQTELLSESTSSDINFLHFLKLRLTAQQRATAQRNYWQRVQQEAGTHANGSAATTSSTASGAIPTVGAEGRTEAAGAATAWNVQPTPPHTATVAAGGRNSRSPVADSSVQSASLPSRPDATPASHVLSVDARHPAFEEMPASAAQRAVTRDASVPATSSSSFVLDGRAATLDDTPALASGTPQVPAGVEEVKEVALEPCPHCGRTFAPERLQRHAVTCERQQLTNPKAKTDGRERKTSSTSTGSSVRGERAAAPAGAGASSAAKIGAASNSGSGAAAAAAAAKTEKWRRQSAQLRNALAGTSAVEDDRVQCPNCGRRFAEEAAARHIPICKAKDGRHA